MELANVITKLASQFQSPLFELPGPSVQQQMAPVGRNELEKQYDKNYEQAAVMILIYPDRNHVAHTVFFERSMDDGVHGGQISLPGGRFEAKDQNLIQTAIRETEEEVGVEVESQKVIGRLTPLKVPVSGFEVTPVVGYTEHVPTFTKEDKEVARIISVQMDELVKAERKEGQFEAMGNRQVNAPYYELAGEKVWGATAMMIAEFLAVLR